MPKRKYSEQVINSARLTGRTLEAQNQFELRRKKIAKLEAGRRASAKARMARGSATTQAQLEARQRATVGKPVPLTPSQEAEALRGRLTEGITPIERLTEALTPKPRKKK